MMKLQLQAASLQSSSSSSEQTEKLGVRSEAATQVLHVILYRLTIMFRVFYLRGTLSAILLVIGVFHVINANCPPGWKHWRDSCFILLSEKLYRSNASRACGVLQSRLFVPNSIEENHFVHVNIQKKNEVNCVIGVSCALWLGCKYEGEMLVCDDQSTEPDFIDHIWAPDPYNYLGYGECVLMALKFNGTWQHFICNSANFVVCEMKQQQPYTYTLVAGNDGRFTPQCLRHHAIRSVPAKGVIGCGEACWDEPLCRSFNLWQGSQHGVCQLNNATHLIKTGRDNVISDKECIYFEL